MSQNQKDQQNQQGGQGGQQGGGGQQKPGQQNPGQQNQQPGQKPIWYADCLLSRPPQLAGLFHFKTQIYETDAQSSRLAVFGGRGMSFNICRGAITRSHMRGFVGALLGLLARQHFLMRPPIGSYLRP